MKSLLIIAASLMVVANVQAEDSMEIGVEMTPMTATKVVAKSDSRFDNYAIENSAAGGQ